MTSMPLKKMTAGEAERGELYAQNAASTGNQDTRLLGRLVRCWSGRSYFAQLGHDLLFIMPGSIISAIVAAILSALFAASMLATPIFLLGLLFVPAVLLLSGYSADLTRLRYSLWRGDSAALPTSTGKPEFRQAKDYFSLLTHLRLWLDYVAETVVLPVVRQAMAVAFLAWIIIALLFMTSWVPYAISGELTTESNIAALLHALSIVGSDATRQLPWVIADFVLYGLLGLGMCALLPLLIHWAARAEGRLTLECLYGKTFTTISLKGWATAVPVTVSPWIVIFHLEWAARQPLSGALVNLDLLVILLWVGTIILTVRKPRWGSITAVCLYGSHLLFAFAYSYVLGIQLEDWTMYGPLLVTFMMIFAALGLHGRMRLAGVTFALTMSLLFLASLINFASSAATGGWDALGETRRVVVPVAGAVSLWVVSAATGYGLRWLATNARNSTLEREARERAENARLEAEFQRAEAEQYRAESEAHSVELTERARIAREMHDVVAHSMSVISVQAHTAPYRLAGSTLDEETKAEFASIASTSKSALTQMRALLAMLRGNDDHRQVEVAPQPSLTDLTALIEHSRETGARIELHLPERGLPTVSATAGLALYRAAQEGLANALRHAPGSLVSVHLVEKPGAIELAVANSAPPSVFEPAPGSGLGLRGVRERVAALNGQVRTHKGADGSFVLIVTIPH